MPRPAGPHTLAALSSKPVAARCSHPDAPCVALLQRPETNPLARATVGYVPLPGTPCQPVAAWCHECGCRPHHFPTRKETGFARSEEHTSELQSLRHLVCR